MTSGELPGTVADYLDIKPRDPGLVRRGLHNLRVQLFCPLYLRAADIVITVSHFSMLELVRFMGVAPNKIRVIYEAADECFAQPLPAEYIDRIRAKHRIPPRFILFVGGFDKRKNVSTLLTAFAALGKEEPDVALVLVGIGGNVEGHKIQAALLGLQEGHNVFFLQRVHDLELAALYRAATLFTTLSWHEGFCLPVVEAMTCGTPVLASAFGAIPEILGEGGWLVDPRRLEDVVQAMLAILRQSDVREDLRARALLRSAEFSWQTTARETWRVYNELTSS